MSNQENQKSKLLTNYLKDVKKKLPDWLKDNKEEVNDILAELEEHIMDHASEISGTDNPDSVSIKKAIDKMGSPEKIARGYKQRGTPKYFISEELWPTYTKVLSFLIPITFIVIALVQVVLVEPNNFLQALTNGITSSYPVIITFVLLATFIFVGLSFEGYLPQDLGTQDRTQEKGEDPTSEFYKPDEFLLNGIVGTFFGLLVIMIPIDMINLFRIIVNIIIGLFGQSPLAMYSTMSADVQVLMTLIGIIAIITGIVNLGKLKTKEVGYQLKVNSFLIGTGIADFALSLYVIANLHLLAEILPISETILFLLAFLGVFGTIVDLIKNTSQSIKLYGLLEEEKGY